MPYKAVHPPENLRRELFVHEMERLGELYYEMEFVFTFRKISFSRYLKTTHPKERILNMIWYRLYRLKEAYKNTMEEDRPFFWVGGKKNASQQHPG